MAKSKQKIKIYLSGPIQNCSDEEIYGWRNEVITKTKKWADCIVPPVFMLDVVTRQDAAKLVNGDKKNIDESDVCLVHIIPGKPATGTHQEEIYAWERGKLVVLIVPSEMDGRHISPWLLHHSNRVFFSIDTAVDFIKEKMKV